MNRKTVITGVVGLLFCSLASAQAEQCYLTLKITDSKSTLESFFNHYYGANNKFSNYYKKNVCFSAPGYYSRKNCTTFIDGQSIQYLVSCQKPVVMLACVNNDLLKKDLCFQSIPVTGVIPPSTYTLTLGDTAKWRAAN